MLTAHAASDHGFSLVEVLVAVGLMTTAVAMLARLFVLSVETNLTSRHRTYAAVLAQQKLEELRAEAFESSSYYPAVGGVEYLDRSGQVVDVATDSSGRGVYMRRWTIDPLPADPINAVVIEVEAARKNPELQLLDRSRLVTVKARRP